MLSPFRLYIAFPVIFIIMHVAGVLAGKLPYIFNAVITFSVVFTALLCFDKWVSGDLIKEIPAKLGLRNTSFKSFLPGVFISVALLMLYPLLGLALNIELFLHDEWLPNLAGLCLTGGLAEELFFRGFLFRHLREKMTFKKAVVVSTALFAAAHLLIFTFMDWQLALSATLLAVFMSPPLAFLFEHGGNTVWAPALVHTSVRTIGLVVATSAEQLMPLALAWMAGCMIVPYLVLLFYKDFREIWSSDAIHS